MGGQRQEKNNLDDSAVLESITSQWWSFSSFVPLVTGALWLWLAASGGLPAVLLGAVPGALLLGTGLSGLLWAVESRTFQYMALASVLGGVLSLPAIFVIGPVAALVLGLGSAASFLATGYLALGQHRCPASVPAPDTGPALAARAAVNELMMCGLILTSWPIVVGTIAVRVQREATEAYALFEEKGWFSDPATYHKDPPPLEEPEIETIEHKGREIERLTFDSLYEPHENEPGRERWLSYRRNPTATRLDPAPPGRAAPVAYLRPRHKDGHPEQEPDALPARVPARGAWAEPDHARPPHARPARYRRPHQRRKDALRRRHGHAAHRRAGYVGPQAARLVAARERRSAGHRGAGPLSGRLRRLAARLAGRGPRLRRGGQPGGRPLAPVLGQRARRRDPLSERRGHPRGDVQEHCCAPSLRSRSSPWSRTSAGPSSPASSTG